MEGSRAKVVDDSRYVDNLSVQVGCGPAARPKFTKEE
jgi:hypothetical protein